MKKILLFAVMILFSSHAFPIDIGQRFIFSLPRTTNTKELKQWMKKTKPAGVLLEAGQLQNRNEVKKLTAQLQTMAKKLKLPTLLICVDWEGGIVSRPNEEGGFVSIPSPYALARAGRSTCFRAGKLIGQQLRNVGINLDFAPSFDLFDDDNYILATRCFSHDPAKAGISAIAFAQGLQSEGVLPVAKHFPGLGLGNHDTHLASVKLDLDQQSFAHHCQPFKQALHAGVPCIMASHAQCEQFGNEPITHSPHAVRYLKSLNPNTLLITDDFGVMKAALNNLTMQAAVLQSLLAGYHLLIFSGTMHDQETLVAQLQEKIDAMPDDVLAACEACAEEIEAFKTEKLQKLPPSSLLDEEKTAALLAQRCVMTTSTKLTQVDATMFSVNLPRIRPSEPWYLENNRTYLAQKLNQEEILLDPKDNESTKLLAESLKNSNPKKQLLLQTFFYGQGVWNSIQEQWLKTLKPYQNKLTIFSLGHPYEKKILPHATIIELGSFHKPLINEVAARLAQKNIETGADRLMQNPKKYLSNKRFGLVCHRCSVTQVNGAPFDQPSLKASADRDAMSSSGRAPFFLPDALVAWAKQQKNKTKLAALFSPEHGLQGTKEAFAHIDNEYDSQWGCPVHSLHGSTRIPTSSMLEGLDLLLIDLQEVGVRCFTYLSTMVLVLEAAAKNHVPVLILDRPNPLHYLPASGPMLEKEHESFLGKIDTSFIHGKTLGTLALEANKKIGAQLTVLSCVGDEAAHTKFFNHFQHAPSPNLATLDAIRVYPSTVFIEGTNYSEGRGTEHPFEQIGAPWVNKNVLATTLNNKQLPGVYFEPISFSPKRIPGKAENPKHKDALCHGVFVHLVDHHQVDPTIIGRALLETLFDLYPQQSTWVKFGTRYGIDLLTGTGSWRETIG